MHRIPRIGSAFALLLALLAPSMACVLPLGHLTASERACCRHMGGECGGMRMPASHSCCQHNAGPSHVDATQPESGSGSFHSAISIAAVVFQSPVAEPAPVVYGRLEAPDH